MIDPVTITNYKLDKAGLEEHAIFWVLVAGKTASTTAKNLNNLLVKIQKPSETPFQAFRKIKNLSVLLKKSGFGCYNQKSRTIKELISSNLDLKTCSVDDLEQIYGIGKKSSRCFILHSRPNISNIACLDTHILKFMADKGVAVPKGTPSGKRYKELEQKFLELVPKNKTVAQYDLEIWNKYRKK